MLKLPVNSPKSITNGSDELIDALVDAVALDIAALDAAALVAEAFDGALSISTRMYSAPSTRAILGVSVGLICY